MAFPGVPPAPPKPPAGARGRAFLATKRARLLARAWWKGRELRRLSGPPTPLGRHDLPCLAVMRNEALRLPRWLDHHRRLGVDRFLVVDNGSADGTREVLEREPDVALWGTEASYRGARFGTDWVNHLLGRFGAGRWCLTLDADELLIYPHWEERGLRALGRALDARSQPALPCLMVELYPKGPVSRAAAALRDDPLPARPFFDPSGYRSRRQARFGCRLVQGGPRDRLLFAANPAAAPTLSKLPFLRWRPGQAYVVSTHFALPASLNAALEGGGIGGALLHTKLGPDLPARAREERARGQHFADPARHERYYDALAADPDFWWPGARAFEGWRQLEALGLMGRGGWD